MGAPHCLFFCPEIHLPRNPFCWVLRSHSSFAIASLLLQECLVFPHCHLVCILHNAVVDCIPLVPKSSRVRTSRPYVVLPHVQLTWLHLAYNLSYTLSCYSMLIHVDTFSRREMHLFHPSCSYARYEFCRCSAIVLSTHWKQLMCCSSMQCQFLLVLMLLLELGAPFQKADGQQTRSNSCMTMYWSTMVQFQFHRS